MIKGLKPEVDEKSYTLILGTIPSKKSIELKEYYANPRNQFWRIIDNIFGIDSKLPYSRRIEKLLVKGIALWDVLESCERSSSLDKDIKQPVVNDLEAFLTKHESIKRIVFNGRNPRKYAEGLLPIFLSKALAFSIILPSSSSANTRYSLNEKIQIWKTPLQASL